MKGEDNAAPRILTAPYYERLEDLERRHWWCRSVRRVALRLVERHVRPGAVILDAGCGAGGLLEAAAERWPEVRLAGLDVSWDALALAQAREIQDLLAGSSSELPFRSKSVDVVFSNDVLQHLSEGEDLLALKESTRVLKRDGVLCLRVNVRHDRAGGASPSPTTRDGARHRQYGSEELAGLIQRTGLRVERHLVLHSLPAALSKWKRPREASHGSEGGLSTRVPPAPVNLLMDLYVRVEDFVVSRLPWTLRKGDAQIVLARKAP